MIRSAMADFEIDLENSWMFGDKTIDVETGINAGMKTAMVLTGYGSAHRSQLRTQPNVIAEDLLAAVLEALR
jgi:histidinol phosphatase-like enzyme